MTAAPPRRTRPPVHPARRGGAARHASSRPAEPRAVQQGAVAHALRLDPTERVDVDGLVEPRAPKHLRVAPTPSKRVLHQRRRARFAIAGVAAISAISMFLLVTFHVFAVQSSFQLDKLEHQRSEAQRMNELLRNQVARRSSATTIFTAARRLGMVSGTPALLNLSASGVSVPNPAPTPVKTPPIDYHAIADSGP